MIRRNNTCRMVRAERVLSPPARLDSPRRTLLGARPAMTSTYPTVPGVTFKSIDGFPGYCVGDDGSVWTERVRFRTSRGPFATHLSGDWRKHPTRPGPTGRYRAIDLYGPDGKVKMAYVHRLVLAAFVGPCPPGMEGCHNDGDSCNNRLSNLRWDTRAGNVRDAVRHGTHVVGSRNGGAKLNAAQIAEIKARFASGESRKNLARDYGVHRVTIGKVVGGRSYQDCGPNAEHRVIAEDVA